MNARLCTQGSISLFFTYTLNTTPITEGMRQGRVYNIFYDSSTLQAMIKCKECIDHAGKKQIQVITQVRQVIRS